MTADDLTRTMRAALDAEREGIRHLDHVAVAEATKAKEAIIKGLLATPASERGPLLEALNAFHEDLRENLILLTHAQAYLHEAKVFARVRKAG